MNNGFDMELKCCFYGAGCGFLFGLAFYCMLINRLPISIVCLISAVFLILKSIRSIKLTLKTVLLEIALAIVSFIITVPVAAIIMGMFFDIHIIYID